MIKKTVIVGLLCWLSIPLQAYKDSTFTKDFSRTWQRTMDYTLTVAKAMPEEHYDFRPTEDIRSFREQLGHLINNFAFLQYYITGKRDSPLKGLGDDLEGKSKEEVIKVVEKGFNFIADLIESTSDEEIIQPVQFFVSTVPMNKEKIFFLMRNHVTHHRGQLILYLRMKKVQPPSYIGW